MIETEQQHYDEIRRMLVPRREIKASPSLRRRVAQTARAARVRRLRSGMLRALLPACAAAAIIAIVFFPTGMSANELLVSAIAAMKPQRSIYVELDIRTRRGDNFAYINPDKPFVRHTLRAVSTDSGLNWWADKGARMACGTSGEAWVWLDDNIGWHVNSSPDKILDYMGIFLRPSDIFESELSATTSGTADNYRIERGNGEITLTVHGYADGDFTNPYMLNKSIAESDNIRRYVFDARSRLLKRASVAIIDSHGNETEVIRLRGIRYGVDTTPLAVTPPDGVKFIDRTRPRQSPHGYAGADAAEVADALLKSLKDWDTDIIYRLIEPEEAEILYRPYLVGAKVLHIGKPFASGRNPDLTFVPYSILYADGRIADMNLALKRQDDGGWRVSGGI